MFTLTPKYRLNSCLICLVERVTISKNDERLAVRRRNNSFCLHPCKKQDSGVSGQDYLKTHF